MQRHDKHVLRSSRHWAERAEEARTLAEHMLNAQAMALMLDIAERYDAIARRTAELEARKHHPTRLN
jgi:hypothetical protein